MSAGSRRVRRHNRERGPCRPTAGPSAGPGVRRFWLPAIDSRIRGKSLSQEALFSRGNSKRGHQPNVHETTALILKLYKALRARTTMHETSATGHIDFLEFANAAAFPFCVQSMQHADPCFYNFKHHPTRAGPCTMHGSRVPAAAFPTHPTHPPTTSSTSPRAGKASLCNEPLNRSVPGSTCERNRSAASQSRRGRRAQRATPLTTSEAHEPDNAAKATLEFPS